MQPVILLVGVPAALGYFGKRQIAAPKQLVERWAIFVLGRLALGGEPP